MLPGCIALTRQPQRFMYRYSRRVSATTVSIAGHRHTWRSTNCLEHVLEHLCNQRGAVRVLDQNGAARQDGVKHCVGCGKQRVVPRREQQHRADGFTRHSHERLFVPHHRSWHEGGECVLHQRPYALHHAIYFVHRLLNGLAHLRSDGLGNSAFAARELLQKPTRANNTERSAMPMALTSSSIKACVLLAQVHTVLQIGSLPLIERGLRQRHFRCGLTSIQPLHSRCDGAIVGIVYGEVAFQAAKGVRIRVFAVSSVYQARTSECLTRLIGEAAT